MLGIKSMRDLEFRLGFSRSELNRIASRIDRYYYSRDEEVGGKVRYIQSPRGRLVLLQKRIHTQLLQSLTLPSYVQGSVKGRSPLGNATPHAGMIYVVSVDVRDFFPSVSHRKVFQVWRERLGCGSQVSSLLTKLTTVERHLPQGTTTSPALANLVMLSVDRRILPLARRLGYHYSRWVDDLTLSSMDAAGQNELIEHVVAAMRDSGFKANRSKVEVVRSDAGPEVTGYGVSGQRPSVGRKFRNKVRVKIHLLGHMEPASREAEILKASVRGCVSHLRQSNPGEAARLSRRLSNVEVNET